jgi:hypothetical protein
MNFKPHPLFTGLIIIFFSAIFFLGFKYWQKQHTPQSLTLSFKAMVAEQPLVFNQINYINPGGAGKFKIGGFQFFLSNIKLIGESGEYIQSESYHIVRFDNQKKTFSLEISRLPQDNYHTLELSLGVDKAANSSIQVRGDLDPNSRMAWSWDVGYKFILFEGALLNNGMLQPLVYHVGFSENYKPLTFQLKPDLFNDKNASLDFKVDIMKLFSGVNNINMLELTSIKFDRDDAKLMANNVAEMLEIDQ